MITMDFVCHGVPSSKVYADMIAYYEKKEGKRAINVTFREKDLGWRQQVLKVYFEDGSVISQPSLDTFFYDAFLRSHSLRKSCYTCSYPEDHKSDITMADFWGAKTGDNKGISLISINTEQGNALFEEIKQCLIFGEVEEKDVPLSFVNHEKMTEYDQDKRSEFFSMYTKDGYQASQKRMKPMIRQRKRTAFKKRIRRILSAVKRRIVK